MENKLKTVVIDFDGTIVEQASKLPQIPAGIGKLKPNAASIIRKLKEEGFEVIIESGRVHPYFEEHETQRRLIMNFLNKHNIPFDDIIPKHPRAFVFVDDRKVFSENWTTIYSLIHEMKRKILTETKD